MFNKQEISEKAKKRYSKENAAEYYLQNKEVIKNKSLEELVREKKNQRVSKEKVPRIDSI